MFVRCWIEEIGGDDIYFHLSLVSGFHTQKEKDLDGNEIFTVWVDFKNGDPSIRLALEKVCTTPGMAMIEVYKVLKKYGILFE